MKNIYEKDWGVYMHRIAVVGDRESIYGFSALGLETFFMEEKDEAKKLIKHLVLDNCMVIYITESLYKELENEIEEINKSTAVSIVPIPGITGNNGVGLESLRKSVIQAVGSDILFSQN